MQKLVKYFYFLYIFPSITFACTTIAFNKAHSDMRLLGYTVMNVTEIGLATCARRCMGISQCKSYNYRMSTQRCELNGLAAGFYELNPETDWIYGDIALWEEVGFAFTNNSNILHFFHRFTYLNSVEMVKFATWKSSRVSRQYNIFEYFSYRNKYLYNNLL